METMITEETNPTQNYRLQFFGEGLEYFKIMIVNWLLTLVTLGFYYPWARAKRLSYLYGNTALNEDRFHFSGTGKEMFIGFIKVVLFYIAVLAFYFFLVTVVNSPILAILFLYIPLLGIIPFAIHGSFRYRMSRTSYRGVRFGYRGDRNFLVKNFFIWLFLTIVTFGIYAFWMQINIIRYTTENIRYGDVEFANDSKGKDWFLLNLKGYFLTIFTLGIYSFWWMRDTFNYYVNHMSMTKGEQKINCYSTATAGGFFELVFINFLLIVFTLGFGKAWADMRTQEFMVHHINLEGNININEIEQTEEEYRDAFGDDAMDFLEIDLA
jgi:uncharacterized membrane protein YjgN (DUF898 family)